MREKGGPEVLELREVPDPEPGPEQVLVQIYAAGVNPIDWKLRSWGIWEVRPPTILGYDIAGVVVQVGERVREFRVGDEVWGMTPLRTHGGGYAEYVAVDANILARKPSTLSFVEAASVPLAAQTAYQCLIEAARLGPGESVLIHAGAGGVGVYAIQIAKLAGATVLTTCRATNVDLVTDLGADVAIDYRTTDFVEAVQEATGGRGVEVCFDTVGGETLMRSFEVVRPSGRVPSITTLASPETAYRCAPKNIHFWRELVVGSRHKLDILGSWLEHRKLRPVLDSVLPLERAAEAHRKLEAGGVRGKIVLQVRES